MAIDTKKYGTQPLWKQFGLPFDVSDYQSTIGYLNTLSDGYLSKNVPEEDLHRMLGVLFKDKAGVEDLYKTASPEYWGGVYEHKLQPSRTKIEGRLSNLRKFGGLETPEKGEYIEGAEALYKQSKTRAGMDVLSLTSKQMSLIDTRLKAIMDAFQVLKESEYGGNIENYVIPDSNIEHYEVFNDMPFVPFQGEDFGEEDLVDNYTNIPIQPPTGIEDFEGYTVYNDAGQVIAQFDEMPYSANFGSISIDGINYTINSRNGNNIYVSSA